MQLQISAFDLTKVVLLRAGTHLDDCLQNSPPATKTEKWTFPTLNNHIFEIVVIAMFK